MQNNFYKYLSISFITLALISCGKNGSSGSGAVEGKGPLQNIADLKIDFNNDGLQKEFVSIDSKVREDLKNAPVTIDHDTIFRSAIEFICDPKNSSQVLEMIYKQIMSKKLISYPDFAEFKKAYCTEPSVFMKALSEASHNGVDLKEVSSMGHKEVHNLIEASVRIAAKLAIEKDTAKKDEQAVKDKNEIPSEPAAQKKKDDEAAAAAAAQKKKDDEAAAAAAAQKKKDDEAAKTNEPGAGEGNEDDDSDLVVTDDEDI
jgi:hypothetical protein